MKNRKSILLIIFSIALALLFTNIDGLDMMKNTTSYKYLIEYRDGLIPGSTYSIYISDDYKVTVEEIKYCSTPECINSEKLYSSEMYEASISPRNKGRLKRYLDELFEGKDTNKVVLYDYDISSNDENIINAIIFDNPDYFKYYKN